MARQPMREEVHDTHRWRVVLVALACPRATGPSGPSGDRHVGDYLSCAMPADPPTPPAYPPAPFPLAWRQSSLVVYATSAQSCTFALCCNRRAFRGTAGALRLLRDEYGARGVWRGFWGSLGSSYRSLCGCSYGSCTFLAGLGRIWGLLGGIVGWGSRGSINAMGSLPVYVGSIFETGGGFLCFLEALGKHGETAYTHCNAAVQRCMFSS